jgi:hypothetical protein
MLQQISLTSILLQVHVQSKQTKRYYTIEHQQQTINDATSNENYIAIEH